MTSDREKRIAEIEALDVCCSDPSDVDVAIKWLVESIRASSARESKLRKALEWYADPKNLIIRQHGREKFNDKDFSSPHHMKARAVLKELDEEEKG